MLQGMEYRRMCQARPGVAPDPLLLEALTYETRRNAAVVLTDTPRDTPPSRAPATH